mmetsp:Transcript_14253/g.33116  ORF Transcript_14253/g.33116 Transcript_14253/m.33116 type:complete len:499 (+) Transcript_14253:78-1574(+)
MRIARAALLAASLVSAASAGLFTTEKKEGDVLILDEENFDTTLATNPKGILVEFYAPWCGHCKKLAPEFAKAASELVGLEEPLHLGMVDATEERALAEKYGVRGFPTLKFFKNSEPAEYEGGRTAKDIVAYMKKKTGPPATLVESTGVLDKIKSSSDVVVTGYFPDMTSAEYKVFVEVADRIDEYEFFYATDKEVIPSAKANSVVLFKKFDEERNDLELTATTTAEELKTFITGMAVEKLTVFTQENTKTIFRGPIKQHMLTFIDLKADYADEFKETLSKVADVNRGKMLHIIVPSTEERVREYFGFKDSDLPKTVIADMGSDSGAGMKKYMFDEVEHTYENLVAFENEFLAGSLTPTLKSEEAKPGHLTGKVKVITGKTFEKEVVKGGKDVLLEFYAPWCGHCKSLAPKWDELGEKFEKADGIMIAKMDATANEIDHPDINVKGFPTIFFIPNEGEPSQYEGAREVEDFVKFLQTHATAPFELEGGMKGGPGFKDEL